MLDAGHYGYRNQSPVVPKYFESIAMWKLQGYLKTALELYGIFVGLTRSKQEKDLEAFSRGLCAKGFDIFISLHSNAVGEKGSEKTNHVSVYAAYDDLNNSHELAARFAAGIADLMEVSNGYVKTRKSEKGDWEYYGVLRGARSAGCPLYFIIEHSFHTNEEAARWLLDEDNLKKLAEMEAAIIAEYYGIKTAYSIGDVNGDGRISALDYLMIKRAVLGTVELTEEQLDAADINRDGKINAIDYTLCKRAVLGTYQIPKGSPA